MTVRVNLELSEELLARVDEAAGDVPRNRWIRRAIERALDAQPKRVPPSLHRALSDAAVADSNPKGGRRGSQK